MINFTFTELTYSATAKINNIDNMPKDIKVFDNLLNLIDYVLQPVRNKYGRIDITSGFRCEKLNKIVGGAKSSNHLYGYACDIIPKQATFKQVYDYITQNLDYDECFIETNKSGSKWLHVAFRKNNNRYKHNPNYLA